MIKLGVSVDTTKLDRLLIRLKAKTADLRPVFHNVINPSITAFFEQQFATEGSTGGKKWKTHAPLTKRLRSRAGHGRGGILRDTNIMWSSFIKGSGPMSIQRIGKHEMERGSRDRKASLHQTGWKSSTIFGRKRRKTVQVPARPIVPKKMPASLVAMWEGAITSHILKS